MDICREAGIPLAGGHSIDSPEPIFGLVVTGVVDPKLVKRNSAAQVRLCCGSHVPFSPAAAEALFPSSFGGGGQHVNPASYQH